MSERPPRMPWLLGAALLLLGACRGPASTPKVPARPQRIVSQTVLSDEILYDLGSDVRARVVGISVLADHPQYSEVAGTWSDSVPRVGASTETLLSLSPDLVFIATFTTAETAALLTRSGVATHVLDGFSGFDDYRRHVRTIADLVDAEDAGERLVLEFDQRLQSFEQASQNRGEILSIVDGRVAGANTTFDAAARAAGFTNVAAVAGIPGHRAVATEQVLVWDPDVIVTGCGATTCEAAVQAFESTPGIAATRAARTGKVVALPDRDLASTGKGMLRLVEHLTRLQPVDVDDRAERSP